MIKKINKFIGLALRSVLTLLSAVARVLLAALVLMFWVLVLPLSILAAADLEIRFKDKKR